MNIDVVPDFKDRGIGFVRVPIPEHIVIVACVECAATIMDDPEGANRALHTTFHRRTWATLRALRDGKADAIQ